MTIKFSPEMNQVLGFSKEEAERLHNESVTPVHLLLAIIRHKENMAVEVLHQLQTDTFMLKQELEDVAKKKQVLIAPAMEDMNFDATSTRIMRICVLEARMMNSEALEPIHLLMAILKISHNDASTVLERMNVDYQAFSNVLKEKKADNRASLTDDDDDSILDDEDDEGLEAAGAEEEGATSVAQLKKRTAGKTPVLDNFGTDLTKAAAEGLLDPVVGREKEVERVAQILCRRKKNNPMLIGQPGVGKSAIVEGLAIRIVSHKISHTLWNKRLVMLDMASVVAGTKYRGQFEERIRAIILELQKNPDVIVFIDEIHTIVGAGSATGTMDAANMLKPALSRGEFQCIGATTIDEFRKTIEKDGALERRFQKVIVDPTTPAQTLQILENLKTRYEEHHNVTYTQEALEACVKLTDRYISDRCFPDKAIDALDEAGSRMHIQDIPIPSEIIALEQTIEQLKADKNEAVKRQNFELAAEFRDQLKQAEEQLYKMQQQWESTINKDPKLIDETTVAEVVSSITGIPVQRIGQEENLQLRNLAATLQKNVIGQDDAISRIVKAIQRSRVGLKDPKKPIGTFMFVGPTGVGKTYLTQCLAEELFGSSDNIIRIDMSEYMEKHTVSRMVGAPPGYVGYDEGGQLTEKVHRKPYSIVLLDEIEKAHPDVFNLLLQVMDEGRLTDGNGQTIDFKNTIIVMTSNCGTKQIRDFGQGIGFQMGEDISKNRKMSNDLVMKALKKQFAPEFLNRIDDIIFFEQLSTEAIQKIVNVELTPLLQRLKDLGIELEISDDVKTILGEKGYDVQYGARPLKRVIQSMLEDPLCEELMKEEHSLSLKAELSGEKVIIVPQK